MADKKNRRPGSVQGGADRSPFSPEELRRRLSHPEQEYPVTRRSVRSALPAAPEDGGREGDE